MHHHVACHWSAADKNIVLRENPFESADVLWRALSTGTTSEGNEWAMCVRGAGRVRLYKAVGNTSIITDTGIIWRAPDTTSAPGNDSAPYKLVMGVGVLVLPQAGRPRRDQCNSVYYSTTSTSSSTSTLSVYCRVYYTTHLGISKQPARSADSKCSKACLSAGCLQHCTTLNLLFETASSTQSIMNAEAAAAEAHPSALLQPFSTE